MVGITSYGVYIPRYRLSRDIVAKAWGPRFISGERAVANHDEDSLTMATEAALNCLLGIDPKTVDGLIFASTTSPYSGKTGFHPGGYSRGFTRRNLHSRPPLFHPGGHGSFKKCHGCREGRERQEYPGSCG